jgi:hypothetical protein
LLLTQEGILRDEIPEERAIGIAAGQAWFAVADCLCVYVDHGISPGMRAAMDAATNIGMAIEIRQLTAAQQQKLGASALKSADLFER